MATHSPTRKRALRRRGPAKPPASEVPAGFLNAWADMVPDWMPKLSPLAAAIARHGESELALARRVFAQLPKRALLPAERLYGVPG